MRVAVQDARLPGRWRKKWAKEAHKSATKVGAEARVHNLFLALPVITWRRGWDPRLISVVIFMKIPQ